MPVRRLLHSLVLAATLGVTVLAGAAAGNAQPPDDDGGVEQPRPLLEAAASCHDGSADVKVFVDDDRDAPFTVLLVATHGSFSQTRNTTLDEEHLVHVVTFPGVPVGEYVVGVAGENGPEDGIPVQVRDCSDIDPGDGPLKVGVECKAGWGIVTFQVADPKTGKEISYTLSVGAVPQFDIELSPGLFIRITQNGYEDGKYTARLTGDGVNVSKPFEVHCESGNAPKLDIATAACAGTTTQVSVGVSNQNRTPVDYTVTLRDVSRTVTVGAGERGVVTFPGVPNGDHAVQVVGKDDTSAAGVVTVDCGGTTTTTTTTATSTTTTTTTTTTVPPTTTTTPAPQGRSGGGLASTGAAVGGLVGLGALTLVLGGLLLVLARRRRARRD
jgi:hypothetical protein